MGLFYSDTAEHFDKTDSTKENVDNFGLTARHEFCWYSKTVS